MHRTLVLLALAACGNPTKTASPDASTSRPPVTIYPDAAVDAAPAVDFTETFSTGTHDTGHWIVTTSSMRPRMINMTGGNPGSYLYAEVSTSTPTWYTQSTHYAPGNNDNVKRDSVFVGDYASAAVTHITVDLDILQVGTWTADRALTIELRSWDNASASPGLVADYSLPDITTPPAGWNHYDFTLAATSPAIPTGWTLIHGDGSPATDAEWATLMRHIDFVGVGYWKPGVGYPSTGTWNLGIDNIQITAQ